MVSVAGKDPGGLSERFTTPPATGCSCAGAGVGFAVRSRLLVPAHDKKLGAGARCKPLDQVWLEERRGGARQIAIVYFDTVVLYVQQKRRVEY